MIIQTGFIAHAYQNLPLVSVAARQLRFSRPYTKYLQRLVWDHLTKLRFVLAVIMSAQPCARALSDFIPTSQEVISNLVDVVSAGSFILSKRKFV